MINVGAGPFQSDISLDAAWLLEYKKKLLRNMKFEAMGAFSWELHPVGISQPQINMSK
jgi:hypothetical protein